MPLSRVERFKAAEKEEMSKLEDKPKPEIVSIVEKPDTITEDQTIESSITSMQNLTVRDPGEPSYEDSEEECEITIDPIDEQHVIREIMKPSLRNTIFRPKMNRGQVTLHGEAWSPVLAASRFPYRYLPEASFQAVATAFFDAGKFWERGWDLFYIWPFESTDRPVALIREEQFCEMLKNVHERFPELNIDPNDKYFRDIRLVIDAFPNHPRMLPRYLGRCNSREDYDGLIFNAPSPSNVGYLDKLTPVEPRTRKQKNDFNELIEYAIDLSRAKPKGIKGKRQEPPVTLRPSLSLQLRRAQRYLGLCKKTERIDTYADSFIATQQQQSKIQEARGGNEIPQLDPSNPAPYPFEEEPIIICVDVEAWEQSSNYITEVGIATLDTRDLKHIPPGSGGNNWHALIHARHFRIAEHMMYENSRWIQGNANGFEFGDSEIIGLRDAPSVIAACFKAPFAKPVDESDSPARLAKHVDCADNGKERLEEPKRKIVFVGHNPSADIRYLQKLSYNPLNLSNLLETLDTAGLFRTYMKEQTTRSVGNILAEFDLPGKNLHNAGNDAVYTLWILIGICVRDAMVRSTQIEDDGMDDSEQKEERRMNDKVKEKKRPFVVPDEFKIW